MWSESDQRTLCYKDREILGIQLDLVYGGCFQTEKELIKRMVPFLKKNLGNITIPFGNLC